MSEDSEKRRRERRRTCVDEMRRDLARRRAQRSDPATKTLLQLLALLSAALALARPSEPSFDFSPRPHRRSRWDPPPGYPNGRDAWARERGLEPEPAAALTAEERPAPALKPALKSWRRLVYELSSRSPQRREAARVQLERRLPSVVHEWLRQQVASDDHTQLRVLGISAGPGELIQRALVAARIERVRDLERASPPAPEPELGVEDEVEENAGPGPGRR